MTILFSWIFIDFSTPIAGFSKYSDIFKPNAVLVGIPVIILLIVCRKHIGKTSLQAASHFDAVAFISQLPYRYWAAFPGIVLFLIFCLTTSRSPEFIYFQFRSLE